MRKKILLLISLGAFLILGTTYLSSCKKDLNGENTEKIIEDGIPDEFNSEIEEMSIDNPPLNDILGYGGTPLQKGTSVKRIVDEMIEYAHSLSEEKNTVIHEEEPNEYDQKGELKYISPKHSGYAYSYGQRNIKKRLPPPQGNSLHKRNKVFGTDCSGLIINLFSKIGIELDRTYTSVAVFESKLKEGIKKSNQKIVVQNLGHLSIDDIKSGDLIRWYNHNPKDPKDDLAHIGIVFERASDKAKCVYQSNGYPNPTEEKQIKNISKNCGIHPFTLSGMMSKSPKGWGSNYTILRLKSIGDTAYGGIIFYIDDSYEHGFVCSKDNIPKGMWDNNCILPNGEYKPILTGASATAIGSGKSNTDLIVSKISGAGTLCASFNGGGFNDWYLPSKGELNEIYKQFAMISVLPSGTYWSSSENQNAILADDQNGNTHSVIIQQAWVQELPSGIYPTDDPRSNAGIKTNQHYICAIRSF